jgi:hypothetical protein
MPYRKQLILCLALASAAIAGPASASPSAAPTLSASAKTLRFGGQLTLTGTIPGAPAGTQIEVMAQACGFTEAAPVGLTRTITGGRFSYSFQPMLNSTVFVRLGAQKTNAATIRISPSVQVRRVTPRTYGVDVTSGNGAWFTKSVLLQRFDAPTKTWKPVAATTLKANSSPDALFAVSSATLHATVRAGTQVRALVPQGTVGGCYLPAVSAPIVG